MRQFFFPDRFGRSVLPPKENHPQRSESRELTAGQRDEHKNR